MKRPRKNHALKTTCHTVLLFLPLSTLFYVYLFVFFIPFNLCANTSIPLTTFTTILPSADPPYDSSTYYDTPTTYYYPPTTYTTNLPSADPPYDSFTYYETPTAYYYPSTTYTLLIPSLHTQMGKGQTYHTGYQTAELTFGLYDTYYTDFRYLDFRFHYIDDSFIHGYGSHYAGNIGIGFREYASRHQEIYGAYIYYDFQCLPHIKLQQIGLGIEFLGHAFDFRSNAYIPIGKRNVFQREDLTLYEDDLFALGTRSKRALWRFEFEIGRYIFCNKIYAAAGPYFFGGTSDCCGTTGTTVGGMGRISIQVTNYFDIDLYGSVDPVFNTCYQVEATLVIPFPCCFKCCRTFFDRIRRSDLILFQTNCTYETNF